MYPFHFVFSLVDLESTTANTFAQNVTTLYCIFIFMSVPSSSEQRFLKAWNVTRNLKRWYPRTLGTFCVAKFAISLMGRRSNNITRRMHRSYLLSMPWHFDWNITNLEKNLQDIKPYKKRIQFKEQVNGAGICKTGGCNL